MLIHAIGANLLSHIVWYHKKLCMITSYRFNLATGCRSMTNTATLLDCVVNMKHFLSIFATSRQQFGNLRTEPMTQNFLPSKVFPSSKAKAKKISLISRIEKMIKIINNHLRCIRIRRLGLWIDAKGSGQQQLFITG